MSNGNDFFCSLSDREIEVPALRARALFGVNDQWMVDSIPIVENKLCELVPEYELHVDPPELMGNSEAYVAGYPLPRMVVNSSIYDRGYKNEPRVRFTLFHEVGHLLLHLKYLQLPMAAAARSFPDSRKLSANSRCERQADRFAVHFLMPEHLVRRFDNPNDLSQGCGVSYATAELRMKELGLWPKRSEAVVRGFEELIAYLKGTGPRPK